MDEEDHRRPCKEGNTKSFALYCEGNEVYEKDKADALEAELEPLRFHRRENIQIRFRSGSQPTADAPRIDNSWQA
jgi:hypothetical protein